MLVILTVVSVEGPIPGTFYSAIFLISLLSYIFNPCNNPKLLVSGVLRQDIPREVFSIYTSVRVSWVWEHVFFSSLHPLQPENSDFFFLRIRWSYVQGRDLAVGMWPSSSQWDINGICWRFQEIFSYLIKEAHTQRNALFSSCLWAFCRKI